MKISKRYVDVAAALALLALSAGAQAHLGADAGTHHPNAGGGAGAALMAGLAHPFSGLDHLLVMLSVGVWSAQSQRRWWPAPLAFAVLLGVGAVLAGSGFVLPAVEPVIAASLLVVGLLLAARQAMPIWASVALVGGFALFHGAAHATELAGFGAPASALLGMVLGTASLHGLGVILGRQLRGRAAWVARLTGSVAAAWGALLIWPALGIAL